MATLSTSKVIAFCLRSTALFLLMQLLRLQKLTLEIPTQYHSAFDQPFNLAAPNERSVIKCTKLNRTTKISVVTNVTTEDFYANAGRGCKHWFKEDTVVFHIGKGGGGALMKHLDIGVQWVHPVPSSSIKKQLQSGPFKYLIVNVRDPIDRFVSAFNWRNAILCHPNDERHRGQKDTNGGKKTGATKNPDDYCKTGHEEEETLLREMYHSNPSALAEALCYDSPLRTRAEKDFVKIHHSTTLTKWLDFLIDPTMEKDIMDDNDGIQHLLVVPLEKQVGAEGTNFLKHIENLKRQLLIYKYGANASEKMMRLAQEKNDKKVKKLRHEMNSTSKLKHQPHLHSSVKFYNDSTKHILSPLGECCLARYLIDDYRLIQSMLEEEQNNAKMVLDPLKDTHKVIRNACSWGDKKSQLSCRGDLLSIIMRRAKYFDESRGSCSAIVFAE